jgi:hypothetical protein
VWGLNNLVGPCAAKCVLVGELQPTLSPVPRLLNLSTFTLSHTVLSRGSLCAAFCEVD